MEIYKLNNEQWEKFDEMLNAPERDTPKLDAIMRRPSIWANEGEPAED